MTQGRVLHPGSASGQILRLDGPLSFWGGFDAATGLIIDKSHPQVGQSLTDRVVVMPGSRGSAGTPGVLAESMRMGTGPAALIVTKADINLTAGAVVASALYDIACPIVLLDAEAFSALADGEPVDVSPDGQITSTQG